MINKLLLYVLAVFISLSGLFAWVSYRQINENGELKTEVTQLEQSLKECENSAYLSRQACVIQDTNVTEYRKQEKEVDVVVKDITGKLDRLPAPPMVPPTPQTPNISKGSEDEKQNYVGLDSKLSPDVVRLLDEAYHSH